MKRGKRNSTNVFHASTAAPPAQGVKLIGNLPTHGGLREDRFTSCVTADGHGHLRKRRFDLRSLGPDGNVIHHVVIHHGAFGEAVGCRRRSEALDTGDLPVPVAETRRVAWAGW